MQPSPSKWKSRSATLCAWLVGLAFLVTGFAKAYDVYGFIEKATYYRTVEARHMLPIALTTIGLELFLGWALCVRWRPRWIAGGSIAVILGFSGLILFAWNAYGIADCGCLGSMVDTPPAASLIKNGCMVLLLVWVFLVPGPQVHRKRVWVGAAGSFALLVACAQMVTSQI
ncbi:MAG: hypothetical protein P1V35_01600 [Planctomycetota bacterium]|nr:hypothetical protein [Planctomycetota bacterium]